MGKNKGADVVLVTRPASPGDACQKWSSKLLKHGLQGGCQQATELRADPRRMMHGCLITNLLLPRTAAQLIPRPAWP
eukprot:scaffold117563_cov20-Tisochrysis_lutea.AAC.1